MKKLSQILIGLFILSFCFSLMAQEDVLSIIRKVDEKQFSKTSKGQMSMIVYPDLYDKNDFRKFKILSYGKGEDDSYMEFIEPKTIKGLRLLSKGNEIWAYFASTGRSRKIAGGDKSKSVQGVGGDFSYEDLGGGKIEEKYNLKLLKSEKKEWEIQGIPKNDDISYSKVIFRIDKVKYLPTIIKMYKDDVHQKSLISKKIKKISGRDVPTIMEMINHEKESKTVVIIHAIKYDIPIDEKYFNSTRFYK